MNALDSNKLAADMKSEMLTTKENIHRLWIQKNQDLNKEKLQEKVKVIKHTQTNKYSDDIVELQKLIEKERYKEFI